MLRGLWKLTWIEIKIFLREPLGAFGTIGIPVLVFVVIGSIVRPQRCAGLARRQQFYRRRPAGARLGPDRSQRRAVAGHDHFDLSRGRHSQTAARHSAAPADDPYRPRDRQAAAHGGHTGFDGAGGQTLLSGGHSCSVVRVYDCAADQHVEHSVDRLSDCQHRSHGALCAADRRGNSVSDDRLSRDCSCPLQRCRRRCGQWHGWCR